MNLIIFTLMISAYGLGLFSISKTIQRLGHKKSVNVYRINYIIKTLKIALTVTFAIIVFLIYGVKYSQQLTVFLSSTFSVFGVAFFAQWSILSNITGSLIIFFGFPYRVGDTIRVVDKDDDIHGVIEQISLFHVIINREGDLITYPNNLILQKAVIKPKDKVLLAAPKTTPSD